MITVRLPSFIYFVTVPLPGRLGNILNELWIAYLLSEFLDLSCLIGGIVAPLTLGSDRISEQPYP